MQEYLHIPSHTIQRLNKEVFVKLVLVPQDGALLQCHRHGCPVFGTFAAGEADSVQLAANLKHGQTSKGCLFAPRVLYTLDRQWNSHNFAITDNEYREVQYSSRIKSLLQGSNSNLNHMAADMCVFAVKSVISLREFHVLRIMPMLAWYRATKGEKVLNNSLNLSFVYKFVPLTL